MASIQFSGLASGLDTDSIVQAMLTTQQNRIDSANQAKTKLEWKKDQWASVNSSINKFYSNYVDKLRLQSTFEKYSVAISSYAVSVKNTGSLPMGTHKVEVTKLASEINKSGDISSDLSSKSKSFKELGLLSDNESTTMIINDKEIEVTASDSLSTLEKKISAADKSLNINFDVGNKKLFISSKETGTKAKLNIDTSSDTTGLFEKIGLSGKNGVCGETGKINEVGTGAEYTYNGVALTSETNDVEINGLKLSLNEKTTEPVIIEVESDPDSVVDFMKEFISAYNELIKDLNDKYSATRVTLDPLTDTQRESMTDKEIEEYEQDIKDSLLRRDSSLKTVIDTLRTSMQNVVKGNPYGSLSAIGITTGDYSEGGKLYLDEEKFRAALEENPEAVKELFTGSGEKSTTITDGKTVTTTEEKTKGIATRLNTSFLALKKRIDGLKAYDSYYNDKLTTDQITSYTEKIEKLQDKYDTLQKLYYKKFTAMETALSKLNSQSSSFTSMLG